MTRALGGEPIRVVDHRLVGVPFRSDNMGGVMVPTLLVMHYTVSAEGPATARDLAHESVKASVHVVLGRDGSMIQQVPFDRIAWHAGPSSWRSRKGCSYFSIGVEIVNWGPLFPAQGGGWLNDYGHPVTPNAEPVEADHPGPPGCPWRFWEPYTDEQMLTLAELCRVLCAEYGITEIVGHEDIAPGRKRDPGPAFDMDTLRLAVFGPPKEAA